MSTLHDSDIPSLLTRVRQLASNVGFAEDHEYWEMVTELHRRGGEVAYETAREWCRSETASLRSLGADILGQLGFSEGYPFADRSVEPLLRLLDDESASSLESAIISLGHLRRGEVATIAKYASDPSSDIRHAVAFAFGYRDDDQARAVLIQLSRDPDSRVRDWATFGLGSLHDDVDSPALREALAERLIDEDAEIRGEAIRGLALRKDERAVSAILDEVVRPDGSDLALEAAAVMPDELLPLLEALHEASPSADRVSEAIESCRRAIADRELSSG